MNRLSAADGISSPASSRVKRTSGSPSRTAASRSAASCRSACATTTRRSRSGCANEPGSGRVIPCRPAGPSKPQVRWLVRTQADCRALVDLLDRYELRGRKRREYETWRTAVEIASSGIAERRFRAPAAPRPSQRRSAPSARRTGRAGRSAPARSRCARRVSARAAVRRGLFQPAAEPRRRQRPSATGRPAAAGDAGPRDRARVPPRLSCVPAGARVDVLARRLGRGHRPDGVLARSRPDARPQGEGAPRLARSGRGAAARSGGRTAEPTSTARIAAFKAARRYRPPSTSCRRGQPQRDARAEDIAALQSWAATEREPAVLSPLRRVSR